MRVSSDFVTVVGCPAGRNVLIGVWKSTLKVDHGALIIKYCRAVRKRTRGGRDTDAHMSRRRRCVYDTGLTHR